MKTKDYKFFDNLYIPAIILILIYLFGNKSKSETYFKFIICLAIPLAVTIFLNKKIIKLELEKSKRIKIVIITFFLEFLFSVQIMFLGIPIIPYLPPPLNNLFFVGAIITIICSSLWKKKEYNKGVIKIILITSWTLIFLYQFSINFIKIKGM